MTRTVYVYENSEDEGTTFIHAVTDVFGYVSNAFIQECHFVRIGYMTIEFADYTASDEPLEDVPINDRTITLPELLRSVGEASYRFEIA